MKKIQISFFILLITTPLLAQQNNVYQQDFMELVALIQNSYPLSDSINDKLLQAEPHYLSELEKCNDEDCFRIIVQRYLAKLNDGHTKIDCYQPFTRKGHHPIKFNFINDELYISTYPKTIPDTFIGKQVITINGVDINTITNKSKKYISADNNVDLRNYLRWLLNQATFYEHIGMDINSELELEFKDHSKISWNRNLDTREFYVKYKDNNYYIDTLKLDYYKKTENELTGWSNKLFEYKILKESNTCYFNFRECLDFQWLNANPKAFKPMPKWIIKIFWFFRGGNFSHFCKKMFAKIEKTGIENLVIDLRENQGGTSILAYQLLDYLVDIENIKNYSETLVLSELLRKNHVDYFNDILKSDGLTGDSLPIKIHSTDSSTVNEVIRSKESHYYQKKPKSKFKGNVYVMVGNRTFSSAAMIAVLLADNNIAKTVGNPMGIGASHNGEVLNFKLSSTGVKGRMSCKAFYRPAKETNLKELDINIKLTNSEHDRFYGVDIEFEKLLKIINSQ